MTEIASKLGKMWKKVPASEKADFAGQAATLKAAYVKKMEKYKGSASWKQHQKALAEFKAKQKKKPFKKDPNAPKRPLSGYMIFVNEVRSGVVADNPDMSVTDILKEVGSMWRDLDEAEYARYGEKAKKLKARYAKELKEYQKTKKYKDYQQEKEEFQAKRKADRKREKMSASPASRKVKKPKRS